MTNGTGSHYGHMGEVFRNFISETFRCRLYRQPNKYKLPNINIYEPASGGPISAPTPPLRNATSAEDDLSHITNKDVNTSGARNKPAPAKLQCNAYVISKSGTPLTKAK